VNDTHTRPPRTLDDHESWHPAARHLAVALVVVGLTALGASGCAGSSGAQSRTTPAVTPAPVTTTTIDPAVLSAFMQPRITAIPVGTYQNPTTPQGPETLVIGEIGASYTELVNSSGERFQGTLSEDPASHHVTFTNAAGAPCAHQPGTYQVSTNGKVVHLQPIADPCPSRAADFVSGAWTA
jgi:hypothetical protein